MAAATAAAATADAARLVEEAERLGRVALRARGVQGRAIAARLPALLAELQAAADARPALLERLQPARAATLRAMAHYEAHRDAIDGDYEFRERVATTLFGCVVRAEWRPRAVGRRQPVAIKRSHLRGERAREAARMVRDGWPEAGDAYVHAEREEAVADRRILENPLDEVRLLLVEQEHPNGANAHFCGLQDFFIQRVGDDHYILHTVMSWCGGGDAMKWTTQHGVVDSEEKMREREAAARPIVRGVVSALEHLAAIDIAHCDVSPENVLIRVGEGGARLACLCDLGQALRGADRAVPALRNLRGKQAYASTENSRGRGYNAAATDVYSLGVTMFVLLVGRFAYNKVGDFYHERITTGRLRDIAPHLPGAGLLSDEAADLIQRMLLREPDRATLAQVRDHPWLREAPARR
jgi:serine/threonine protein kinase